MIQLFMKGDKMLEECIDKLRPIVKELCKKYKTGGHDIDHFNRTMKIALYLQSKEGGDVLIIGISSFLHDIHRLMQTEQSKYINPKDSLDEVIKIIEKSKIELTSDQINKILFCIEHHEDYNWNGFNVDDINTLILQDADNLDAIGAIGIGRSFGYAALNNQVFYDDKIPLEKFDGYEEKIKDVSNIHFLNNKLVKLGDNMNTKTAKLIAKDRVEFIKKFIDEYIKEWNANY